MHEPTDLLEPDDLLQMPGGESYELVDGRLVEKHMGAESDRIAVRLAGKLDQFCSAGNVGFVFGSSTGYRIPLLRDAAETGTQAGRVRRPPRTLAGRARAQGRHCHRAGFGRRIGFAE
jgi:hypothetical protein